MKPSAGAQAFADRARVAEVAGAEAVQIAATFAAAQLRDPQADWSIGTFGAIGEFMRDADEPCEVTDLAVVTPRGGIRFTPPAGVHGDTAPPVQVRAYELLSARAGVWHQGVVFCIPVKRAYPAGAGGIVELGPDTGALREQDRDAILFDLAVGGTGCRFCIRTSDAGLIETLRGAGGARLLDLGDAVWAQLLSASPNRVVFSPLGRIEIYGRIAEPDGKTPFGPHTHLIPKLLRQKRGHSASIPVPEGMLPVLTLYPPHPIQDGMAQAKPFDREQYAAFQELLERFGDADAWKAKRWLMDAVRSGAEPSGWAPPKSRAGRTACRVAMRQLRHELGDTMVVRAWEAQVGDVQGEAAEH